MGNFRDSPQTWHPWETQNVFRRSRYLCDMVIVTRRIKSSLSGEEIHLLALNYVLMSVVGVGLSALAM